MQFIKMDPAKAILYRPDYRRGMSSIHDVQSYHEFMCQHFSKDIDIDRILVFATISRDVLKSLPHLHLSYLAWLTVLQGYMTSTDFEFLSTLWTECKFL